MDENKVNKKSDPRVHFPGVNEHFEGLDAATTDKADYGMHNASATSEQRTGEDLKLPEKGGRGYTDTKTASERLVEGIEKRM